MVGKYLMLNSIVKSKKVIPYNVIAEVTGTVQVSDMETLVNKSYEELRSLKIDRITWNFPKMLGFVLTDGQNCLSGPCEPTNIIHMFDPSKKITKIECFIQKDE